MVLIKLLVCFFIIGLLFLIFVEDVKENRIAAEYNKILREHIEIEKLKFSQNKGGD